MKPDNIKANMINTGSSFTNFEVMKYFKLLRTYALNRCRWTSDHMPEEELRLIEWNIFHYGVCAMLKPRITKNNVRFTSARPKIYQCNFTDINYRNGRPLKITISNQESRHFIIDTEYDEKDFTIFTDEFLFAQSTNPMVNIAWEYACKLHELDLAFNANSHRLRMPFVFNTASQSHDNTNNHAPVLNSGISVAEIMRSAFGRNEQFIEIPESTVSKDGFMHEPQYVNNHMLEHIEAQKKLYQAYMEILGLYTDKEKTGSYKVRRLQEEGDDSPDFITETYKSTRILCAKEASLKFGINLIVEII